MGVRRRCLPAGWYPGTAEGIREAVRAWGLPGPAGRTAVAGVAPHAGWEFSGALAGRVFAGLAADLDTIVIIGGHLAAGDGILYAAEDAWETPLGPAPADADLLAAVRATVPMAEDRWADNTVEVQLPLARYVFPRARVLGLRAPPAPAAAELGRALAAAADRLGRRVGVVGSTDLTHYGPNYGFAPSGDGPAAERWVRDVNDRHFVDALLVMDEEAALRHALRDRAACSAGGAVAAMAFARVRGAKRGELLAYGTSREVHPSDSFVGYAAVAWRSEG